MGESEKIMNDTMIKKHESRLNEITAEMIEIMGDSMIPTLTILVSKLKKLAEMMGYDDILSFMSHDENDLQEQFCLMDEDQQTEAESLVKEINTLVDGTTPKTEVMESLIQEADIIQNVLHALGVNEE